MLLDLIQNTTLLITLSVFYGIMVRYRHRNLIVWKIITGVWFGLIAVLGMAMPFVYQPGAIYDGRSIVLALAGLFGGGYASLIAALIAGIFRIYIGGVGVWAGLSTIVFCTLTGLIVRRLYHNEPFRINLLNLYGIGLVVHIVMLLCQLILPAESRWEIISSIWMPVLLIFPFAFVMMGFLLGSEERRLLREEKFRNMFEDHKAVHLLIDPASGRIENANKAAADFYGWSVEELKSMRIHDINTLPLEELSREMELAKNHQKNYFEFRHRTAYGAIRDVETFSSRVEIRGKWYLYSIIHDVSEKKQLLRDLEIAKEQAEESDRLKSAFLANMSHEIRTPLNGILGFSELLVEEESLTADEKKLYGRIISRSGDNLARLVDDILDISKLETGQISIVPEVFCVNEVLNDIHKVFVNKLEQEEKQAVELILHPAPEDLKIRTDQSRYVQILSNLLENAVKFTDHGHIIFGFKAINSHLISFEVTDTGIGIPQDKQKEIFERFKQLEVETRRKKKGTGLGLSIVQKLTELLGGSVEVYSENGKGASFVFSIQIDQTA